MIKRAFTRLWSNERGNVLIIAAAAMPMLVGSAGLATDTIQWALWKRQLQRAADSAAIAGVYERVKTPNGATTGVQAAVLRDLALNQHAGTLYGSPDLAFPANVTTPDKRTNQVSVTLKLQKALTFSSFFLDTPPIIAASATAASVPGAGEYCVVSLDDRNVVGTEIAGSTNIDLGQCCMISNSKDQDEAFRNTGNGSEVKAGCIAAVGAVKYSESEKWKVGNYYPYSEQALDPFADVTVPAEAACERKISFGSKADEQSYKPEEALADAGKVVCINGGFEIKGALNLGSATYVINTNSPSDDLTMHATGASLTCTNCTIILTNYTDPTRTGNIRLNGGTVNIAAPVTDGHPYQGVALYQDRLAADDNRRGTNHVNGNSNSGVQGAIYTPARSLMFNGGGTMSEEGKCMQIVARRVDFSGNSKFKLGSACKSAGLKGHSGGGWLVRLVS